MKKIILLTMFLAFYVNAEWAHKNISTAVFALNVVKRVPQNIVSDINNDIKKIYFYTNFRNLAGRTLKHRWIYNGKNMAEIKFSPKGNRWRVYSSKNLWKNWTGTWKVEVLDENNNILLTKSFTYNKK